MQRIETQGTASPSKRCLLSRQKASLDPAPRESAHFEARSSREWIEQERALEPVESPLDEEQPRVVAEVLSDGTVQVLDRAGEARGAGPWGSGVIAGKGWTMWWERRRWA